MNELNLEHCKRISSVFSDRWKFGHKSRMIEFNDITIWGQHGGAVVSTVSGVRLIGDCLQV